MSVGEDQTKKIMKAEEIKQTHPSTKYRLMIYFAHSTMVLYSKTLVSHKQMNPEEFYNANKKVMQRVFDEGINIMAYELSHNQKMKACYFYLSSKYYPQSVDETEAFVLDGDNTKGN